MKSMKKIRRILIALLAVTFVMLGKVSIVPEVLKDDISNSIYAYNHDASNALENVFEQDGSLILPFIFDDASNTITKAYLIEQFQERGLTIQNENDLKEIIATGDQIQTNTKTYTILIYGDVDENGEVNVFDAQRILQHAILEGPYTLTGIDKIAGNVLNDDDSLDVFDAERVLKFWAGTQKKLVLNEPDSLNTPPALPRDLTVEYGTLLSAIKLPTGWTFDNMTATSDVGEIGTKNFPVTFTPQDIDKYEIVHANLTITVKKATPTAPQLPGNLTATYGDLLSTIVLPSGWTFDGMTATSTVGNATTTGNSFAVTYTPADTVHYEVIKNSVKIIVDKAVPTNVPELPESITATQGDLLSSIELPSGWTFDGMTATSTVGNVVNLDGISFNVTYTPADTANYSTIPGTIKIIVKQETGKIFAIEKVANSTDKSELYCYDNASIATIKSSNELLPLAQGTAECSLTAKVLEPANSKATVAIEPGEVEGQFKVKLYATEAGNYKVEVKAKGTDVKNGEVTLTIDVTVKESYEVTDIKIDGKWVTGTDATEKIEIPVRMDKTTELPMEFYHKYTDINDQPVYGKVEGENLRKVHTTFDHSSTSKIDTVVLRNQEEDKTVDWQTATGNSYLPTHISITANAEGDQELVFHVQNNSTYANKTIDRAVKVVITKAKIEDVTVLQGIDLYTYYPSEDEISEANKEKYTVIKNTDKEDNNAERIYTVFPIKVTDEDQSIIKPKKAQIQYTVDSIYDEDAITFLDTTFDTDNIKVKAFTLVDGTYVEANSTQQKIDAVGIALKNPNNADSVEAVSAGINLYHYKASINDMYQKEIKVNIVKEQIIGIKNLSDSEMAKPPHYCYDNITSVATIKSTNDVALTKNTQGCTLSAKVVEPAKSNAIVAIKDGQNSGEFDVTLYAPVAGDYKIEVKAKGTDVRDGEVTLTIDVTVEESYEVTDVKINGEFVTGTDATEKIEIPVRMDKTAELPIEFYHTYTDINDQPVHNKVEGENLRKVHTTFDNSPTSKIDTVILRNQEEDKTVDWQTATGNTYLPTHISITADTEGDQELVFHVQNNSTYANKAIDRAVKVSITKAKIEDVTVLQGIDLYTYYPAEDEIPEANKDKYKVIKNTDKEDNNAERIYTVFPIEVTDEDSSVIKPKKGQIQYTMDAMFDEDTITFLEAESFDTENIKVKAFTLVEGVYVEANSTQQKIDAIGIALINPTNADSVEAVSEGINVYHYKASAEEMTSKLITVNIVNEQIKGIKNLSDSEMAKPPHYCYDNITSIATIKSTNDVALTKNTSACTLSAKVVKPANSNAIVAIKDGQNSGEFDITLYATDAKDYEIEVKAQGTGVKNGAVSLTITATVEENYEITDVKINGEFVTGTDATEKTEIQVKADKAEELPIEFYHEYTDIDSKPVYSKVEGENLRKVHTTFDDNGEQSKIDTVVLRNKQADKTVEWQSTTGNTYLPTHISITANAEGSEEFVFHVQNNSTYGNKTIDRAVKVSITKAKIEDVTILQGIDLYKSYPSKDEIEANKDKYDVIKNTDAEDNNAERIYTVFPIKVTDEDTSVIKPKKGQIQYTMDAMFDEDAITFLEAESYATENIKVKAFTLVEGVYVEANNTQQKIDAVGIALTNPTDADSVDAVRAGINVYHYKASIDDMNEKSIAVTIKPSSSTFANRMKKQATSEIEMIAIKEAPTAIYLGDELDYSEAKLTVIYADGKEEEIDITEDMVEGYDETSLEKQTITVTYKNETTTFTIELQGKELEEVSNTIYTNNVVE